MSFNPLGISAETRLRRLRHLRETVRLHVGARGKPVKLNGRSAKWNMDNWCGTSACAFGSYAMTPYARRSLVIRGDVFDGDEEDVFDLGFPGRGIIRLKRGGDKIDNDDEFEVAAAHFGIPMDESEYLFSPDEYPRRYSKEMERLPISPSEVVKRIDFIIRRYERRR